MNTKNPKKDRIKNYKDVKLFDFPKKKQSIDVFIVLKNSVKKLFKTSFSTLFLSLPHSSMNHITFISDNFSIKENKRFNVIKIKELLSITDYKKLKKHINPVWLVDEKFLKDKKFLAFSKQFKRYLKNIEILPLLFWNECQKKHYRMVKLHNSGLLYFSFSNTHRNQKEINDDINNMLLELKNQFLKKFSQTMKIKRLFISSTFGKNSYRII